MTSFIENQQWRYATKRFDPSKKVSEASLTQLKEAIRLSSSSYGLQPYKVIVIEDDNIRSQLKPAAWNQSQITDASHLIVFATINDFGDTEIDDFVSNISSSRNIALEKISDYGTFMKSKISTLPADIKNNWAAKQAYIALANLLNAAAELRIDVTPMEGFDPNLFDAILGLKEQGLHATVIATVGYRHDDDEAQHQKKVRKSNEELFINL